MKLLLQINKEIEKNIIFDTRSEEKLEEFITFIKDKVNSFPASPSKTKFENDLSHFETEIQNSSLDSDYKRAFSSFDELALDYLRSQLPEKYRQGIFSSIHTEIDTKFNDVKKNIINLFLFDNYLSFFLDFEKNFNIELKDLVSEKDLLDYIKNNFLSPKYAFVEPVKKVIKDENGDAIGEYFETDLEERGNKLKLEQNLKIIEKFLKENILDNIITAIENEMSKTGETPVTDPELLVQLKTDGHLTNQTDWKDLINDATATCLATKKTNIEASLIAKRKDKEWEIFFNDKTIFVIDQLVWKNQTGFTPVEARKAYEKGWENIRTDSALDEYGKITNIANKKLNYASHGQPALEVDPQIHDKNEIDKANLLLRKIKSENLTELKKAQTEVGSVRENVSLLTDIKLPTGLQQNSLIAILNNQINQLENRALEENLKNFRAEFKAASGNSASVTDDKIDPYFDKGLKTGTQAATLYNSNPRIEASELKNDKSGTVDYVDGKNYDVKKQAGIDGLNAAKKLKADLILAQTNAKIKDKDGKDWNPPLTDKEKEIIDKTTDLAGVSTAQTTIADNCLTNAKNNALINDKNGKKWSPELTQSEKEQINKANNFAEIIAAQEKIATDRAAQNNNQQPSSDGLSTPQKVGIGLAAVAVVSFLAWKVFEIIKRRINLEEEKDAEKSN